jgi:hypothetical protein
VGVGKDVRPFPRSGDWTLLPNISGDKGVYGRRFEREGLQNTVERVSDAAVEMKSRKQYSSEGMHNHAERI